MSFSQVNEGYPQDIWSNGLDLGSRSLSPAISRAGAVDFSTYVNSQISGLFLFPSIPTLKCQNSHLSFEAYLSGSFSKSSLRVTSSINILVWLPSYCMWQFYHVFGNCFTWSSFFLVSSVSFSAAHHLTPRPMPHILGLGDSSTCFKIFSTVELYSCLRVPVWCYWPWVNPGSRLLSSLLLAIFLKAAII